MAGNRFSKSSLKLGVNPESQMHNTATEKKINYKDVSLSPHANKIKGCVRTVAQQQSRSDLAAAGQQSCSGLALTRERHGSMTTRSAMEDWTTACGGTVYKSGVLQHTALWIFMSHSYWFYWWYECDLYEIRLRNTTILYCHPDLRLWISSSEYFWFIL